VKQPLIINGRRTGKTNGHFNALISRTGDEIELPQLSESAVDDILEQPRFSLRDVPLHEIVTFLHNVGQNWKTHEYTRRRLYIRYLKRYFGYNQKMAETEANWVALFYRHTIGSSTS